MGVLFALTLAALTPITPLPPRVSVATRVRILRGSRINLRNPARKPVEAIIRKGLIEFP
jgi:hypothetical protein